MELALTKFGRLDGMVVSHGVLQPLSRLDNAPLEEWKQLYDVNLFSGVALVRLSPHWSESRG